MSEAALPAFPPIAPGTPLPLQVLAWLDRAATLALLLAVAAMVGIVSAQVLLRYGFNGSIDWADEVSRLAFVWTLFLALPLAVREGAHIGIDLVLNALPMVASRALRRAAALLALAMMAAIAWAAVGVALEQWDELMATLDWSVGWFIVPVAVGTGLSALHLLRVVLLGPPAADPEAMNTLGAAE